MTVKIAFISEFKWHLDVQTAENTKPLAVCDLLVFMLLCPMALQCFVPLTIMCNETENCRAIGQNTKDQEITNLQGFWLIN